MQVDYALEEMLLMSYATAGWLYPYTRANACLGTTANVRCGNYLTGCFIVSPASQGCYQ